MIILYSLHEHNYMFAFAQIFSFYMSSLTQTLGPQITEKSPYHQKSWDPISLVIWGREVPISVGIWGRGPQNAGSSFHVETSVRVKWGPPNLGTPVPIFPVIWGPQAPISLGIWGPGVPRTLVNGDLSVI